MNSAKTGSFGIIEPKPANMEQQNFKNHSRLVPLWHFFTGGLILAALVAAIIRMVQFDPVTKVLDAIVLIVTIVLCLIFVFTRAFALKAQDRAIRAEESLRYYILTNERLDPRLRLGQIIALRFAADDEFVALAKRAAEENLRPKEIKQAIQHWRADFHRV